MLLILSSFHPYQPEHSTFHWCICWCHSMTCVSVVSSPPFYGSLIILLIVNVRKSVKNFDSRTHKIEEREDDFQLVVILSKSLHTFCTQLWISFPDPLFSTCWKQEDNFQEALKKISGEGAYLWEVIFLAIWLPKKESKHWIAELQNFLTY